MQEPVLERRTLDLDVVGELEDALERARCNTLVEDLADFFSSFDCFSPLIVRVFSLVSIERSLSPKPATATEMR